MAKYIRPTLKTKYHIDFPWWKTAGRNFRSFLLNHACGECRDILGVEPEQKVMDWVDPDTAQIFAVDQLWYQIQAHCSQQPDFIPANLPLTTSIFRLFIANNNRPLTPVEIHQELRRKDARTILRTIGGRTVYQGIRPVALIISR